MFISSENCGLVSWVSYSLNSVLSTKLPATYAFCLFPPVGKFVVMIYFYLYYFILFCMYFKELCLQFEPSAEIFYKIDISHKH